MTQRQRIGNPAPIKRVCVVGGTHGNEWTGAHLVRHWQKDPAEITRAGLEVEALLANPDAVNEVRRYLDQDLNRCFKSESLAAAAVAPGAEHARARKLVPKLLAGRAPHEIAIFDCHTSTASMGKSVVLGALTPFNAALSAWLVKRDPSVRLYQWLETGAGGEQGFLSSICPHGFNLEVGPVAGGVLDPTMLAFTRELVRDCLDFVVAYNAPGFLSAMADEVLVLHRHVAHVDYPRDDEGWPNAFVHPDRLGTDFQPLSPGDPLFLRLDGEVLTYEGPAGRVPVFINEAAYYEKGIAMTLTVMEEIRIDDLL